MDPSSEGRFDEAFLSVLSSVGKMDAFIEHIYNFLFRRTDYYIVMNSKTDKMGFPPGAAEKMSRGFFIKYMQLAKERGSAQQPSSTSSSAAAAQKEPQPASSVSMDVTPERHVSAAAPAEASEGARHLVERGSSTPAAAPSTASASQSTASQATAATSSSDTYNGDVTDDYVWSQTATDIDLKVPLQSGVKAAHLQVDFKAKSLKVTSKANGKEDVLLSGELFDQVRASECMWSKDGSFLQIMLEKKKDYLWKSVFVGGREIDINKADNTRQLNEYDDETQFGVRKAMYDQEQKLKGLPTSDEQKTMSTLEKAWNAEGSPFKGTPYDPSVLNMSGSNLAGLPPGAAKPL